jgi:hypothetical protein
MVIYQTRLTSESRHYSIETSVRRRSILRRGVEHIKEPVFSFRYFPFNSQRRMFYFTDVLNHSDVVKNLSVINKYSI